MELTLPKKANVDAPIVLDTRILVVIGTNGAGKSSFGRDLLERYAPRAKKISGIHALFIGGDEADVPESNEFALLQSMIQERLFVPRISEYEKLILQLRSEEFEAAVDFKEACKRDKDAQPPVTKIDTIQTIWEKMFPHNRLIRKSGFIELVSTGRDSSSYTAGRMSDSEKLVFYLIGAVLCASPGALLVVEEPGTLLHDSIKTQLWDEIEAIRPDCTFVYLTHDIDFAASRVESTCIWVRSFDAEHMSWDYEFIRNDDTFPEGMYLDILGSRKPVLFIEGASTGSIDVKLYPYIFPEYIVKPLGGCNKVIEATRAFADLKEIHHLESRGIVDRDRRTEREVEYLRSRHIYVPEVAEVENLLMLEGVIRAVARRMKRNENKVFEIVKNNVIQLFAQEIESQALLHTRHRIRRNLEYQIDRRFNDINAFEEHIDHLTDDTDVRGLYNSICSQFRSFVKNRDYRSILKVYNQKSMLTNSNVCNLCGLANKDKYLRVILTILRDDRPEADSIRSAIRACFKIDKEDAHE